MTPSPFFLEVPDGRRFCLFHPVAAGTARGAILYLHPFAEEMNKSRRMAALQARAFAHSGYAVLQIDLLGCGESSGDFGDANWDDWVGDASSAAAWLRQRHPGPLWYWGLRTGALLATEAAALDATPAGLLLWNPVESGDRYLTHLLRMKRAASLSAGDGPVRIEALRKHLADGFPIEVGGYAIAPAMAHALQDLDLAELAGKVAPTAVRWLEAGAGSAAASADSAAMQAFVARGADLRFRRVEGPAFWQTTEIETAPQLISASLEELGGAE